MESHLQQLAIRRPVPDVARDRAAPRIRRAACSRPGKRWEDGGDLADEGRPSETLIDCWYVTKIGPGSLQLDRRYAGRLGDGSGFRERDPGWH